MVGAFVAALAGGVVSAADFSLMESVVVASLCDYKSERTSEEKRDDMLMTQDLL